MCSDRGVDQVRECGLQGECDVSAVVEDGTPSSCASDHRRHGVRVPGRPCDTDGLVSNTRALPRSQRSSCSATSIAACLRRAHSQTVATRQPAWRRSCRLRRSRSVFASNFARQNSWRVDGVAAYGQPACRCQKQPCTSAASRPNLRIRTWPYGHIVNDLPAPHTRTFGCGAALGTRR